MRVRSRGVPALVVVPVTLLIIPTFALAVATWRPARHVDRVAVKSTPTTITASPGALQEAAVQQLATERDRRNWLSYAAWVTKVAEERAREEAIAASRQAPAHHASSTVPARSSASTATAGPCGGDLPPCYVMQRESGGSYSAYNPSGCGGAGCYGKWQFSGEWACKLGLPCDLSTATPEQQDAAARQLWAGGSGCSNWAACG